MDEFLLTVITDLELAHDATCEPSLAEFEQDMDASAHGLENLTRRYERTYSREDIYLDYD